MVKKTILAIVVIVLLVAVFSGAVQRLYAGYSPYRYYYTYYPVEYYAGSYAYPSHQTPTYYAPYQPPSYAYPYYSQTGYPYGTPEVSYPASSVEETPRGAAGQLCGSVDGIAYGCYYGLVCDYAAIGRTGVGVCARQ